ncbi:MAG TPA: MlaD family protein, partial [Alphaproteobacteria bacterium]|nr:MlaD family protein [Alphaproteobacteria bacterium]
MAQDPATRRAALRVTLTIVVSALMVAGAIYFFAGERRESTAFVTLTTYIDNVGDLKIGSPVKVHGIAAGNVTRITLVPNHAPNSIQVRMRLNAAEAKAIDQGSIAIMETAGLLGGTYIDIVAGSAAGLPVKSGDEVAAQTGGDFMNLARTWQTALDHFQKINASYDRMSASVAAGKGTLGAVIHDKQTQRRFTETFKELNEVVDQATSGKNDLGRIFNPSGSELFDSATRFGRRAKQLSEDMKAGQGTLGGFLYDPQFR